MGALFFFLLFGFVYFGRISSNSDSYKVGLMEGSTITAEDVRDAARHFERKNLDFIVMPSIRCGTSKVCSKEENFEVLRTVSEQAKILNAYISIESFEKQLCDGREEIFGCVDVFDRDGKHLVVYRKPQNSRANCNGTSKSSPIFETDFGAQMSLVSMADVAKVAQERNAKNFLVVGDDWPENIPFLNASQILSLMAKRYNVNILSTAGVFYGSAVEDIAFNDNITVKIFNVLDEPKTDHTPSTVVNDVVSQKQLAQFQLSPVDGSAATRGIEKTVCDADFCCHFYVQSRDEISSNVTLAVMKGVHPLADGELNVEICTIMEIQNEGTNKKPVNFKNIQITGNFTKYATSDCLNTVTIANTLLSNYDFSLDFNPVKDVNTDRHVNRVTLRLKESVNLKYFGVLSWEFSNESKYASNSNNGYSDNLYDFMFTNDMMEWYDYLWIRLRVVIFIVSIYVLEMM